MAHIKIPQPLQKLTGQQSKIYVEASDVQAALRELIKCYPAFMPYLFDEQNNICPYLSIYLNDTDDIRYLKESNSPLNPSDTLTIMLAVAGG